MITNWSKLITLQLCPKKTGTFSFSSTIDPRHIAMAVLRLFHTMLVHLQIIKKKSEHVLMNLIIMQVISLRIQPPLRAPTACCVWKGELNKPSERGEAAVFAGY